MEDKVAVLGAGSWATALAVLLAGRGCPVLMWSRRAALAEEINRQRRNAGYLPGVDIPENVHATVDLAGALHNARAVVFGVPSHAFRETLRAALPELTAQTLIVNAAKGIEEDSLLRLSRVFAAEAGEERLCRYVVLSGPSHAEEVGRGMATAVVVASADPAAAGEAQDLFMTGSFRVYTNPDVTGVELAGALKNVIALGTGIADGLGCGDNTKAALITRGLAEITRLGMALGANVLTFAGLAGVGDLIVTCTSMHSRNRRAGIEIGRGRTLDEAVASVHMVVEGVRTTRAAYRLAAQYGVEMPITEQMYRVLFEHLPPRQALENLMSRGRRREMEEVALAAVAWRYDRVQK
ncbi:NAD(P)H-dependent glycerol-3-phosphate dehydrogenase [Desulfotomaculum copahuensis]|uniref:Glycerol-3-phosphate dehydrogenase [NAD(P)+] n=1 Tax=Desulfotomaculum copahuensis TaxID=1838280 RepID=A0A1B7LIK3_9FIRM|nr:NAD(P)H-dependent glycerol-3-phosphate dehydrogenase [Desulfotomaculum copahuensis]OAT86405.1 glycerol-3-phosphate dehydrogenase [Desulfotomaculum copahuensis]